MFYGAFKPFFITFHYVFVMLLTLWDFTHSEHVRGKQADGGSRCGRGVVSQAAGIVERCNKGGYIYGRSGV
jgi:hypothetical protein